MFSKTNNGGNLTACVESVCLLLYNAKEGLAPALGVCCPEVSKRISADPAECVRTSSNNRCKACFCASPHGGKVGGCSLPTYPLCGKAKQGQKTISIFQLLSDLECGENRRIMKTPEAAFCEVVETAWENMSRGPRLLSLTRKACGLSSDSFS